MMLPVLEFQWLGKIEHEGQLGRIGQHAAGSSIPDGRGETIHDERTFFAAPDCIRNGPRANDFS